MIGLVNDPISGPLNRLAITYNGLTLNNPADAINNTYQIDSVTPATQFDTITDPSPGSDGMEAYNVFKAARLLTLKGVIRAPSVAALYDKVKLLALSFDPAKITHENPSGGFLKMTFSVPTLDLTDYSTGLVPSFYYARPRDIPEPTDSTLMGTDLPFKIDMLLIDPNRYYQTQSSQTGAGAIANTLADYRSYPTITITMAGAGSATYTYGLTNSIDAAVSLVLNLSSTVNTDVITVDPQNARILKNGTDATGTFYVSGAYPLIEPGTNTVTLTNVTNATTVTTFYPAFCL